MPKSNPASLFWVPEEVDEVIYDGLNLQWTTPGYPNNYEDGTNMSLSVMVRRD